MTRVGDRVELIRCEDPYTVLKRGELGNVVFVDDTGTVHVSWDSGSSLGMIPGEDEWRVVERAK